MTKKETEEALKAVEEELKTYPDAVMFGDPRFFKFWKLLWHEKAYKIFLEKGIDPDSVIHPGCIDDGEGTPFK